MKTNRPLINDLDMLVGKILLSVDDGFITSVTEVSEDRIRGVSFFNAECSPPEIFRGDLQEMRFIVLEKKEAELVFRKARKIVLKAFPELKK
jgi:hypothetical protein